MIFYLATQADGMRRLETVATKAKAIDKDYATLEIGTSKPELQEVLQELLTLADTAALGAKKFDGVMTEAVEQLDGIINDIDHEPSIDQHDGRCSKCHRILAATERGARTIALGEDLTTIQEMIDHSPDWFCKGLQGAITERFLRKLDDEEAESETLDVEQTPGSEA